MDYARTAVRHFHTTPHEYYVTPDDVAEWLPPIAAATDEPFGNSSLLPAYCCARFAREQGITRMLGGDGGDELFAGNERYATQGIFERFGRLPSVLQTLIGAAVNPLANVPLARKAHSYVKQARVPLPDRLDSYAYLVRHDPAEMFNPDFLAQVSTAEPLELKRAAFFAPEEASTLNRMLYLDWHFTPRPVGWRGSKSPIRCWMMRWWNSPAGFPPRRNCEERPCAGFTRKPCGIFYPGRSLPRKSTALDCRSGSGRAPIRACWRSPMTP